jgi:segregation and condensation protein A
MQIKAKTLLPRPSSGSEEEEDPRADLVTRLLEYQRFKEASRHWNKKLIAAKDVHFRGAPVLNEGRLHVGGVPLICWMPSAMSLKT